MANASTIQTQLSLSSQRASIGRGTNRPSRAVDAHVVGKANIHRSEQVKLEVRVGNRSRRAIENITRGAFTTNHSGELVPVGPRRVRAKDAEPMDVSRAYKPLNFDLSNTSAVNETRSKKPPEAEVDAA